MPVSIQLNGKKYTFDQEATIASLLKMLNIPGGSVIVEHNRNVVHKVNFGHTMVNNGDEIELIRIVGGG